MTRTRIKICGLTTPEDALSAVSAGADALGVVLAASPREVSIEQASCVFARIPPFVTRVGVFVDARPAFVAEAAEVLGLHLAQFHGDESPEACAAAPVPVVKAVRVAETTDVASALEPYRDAAAAFLLDTYVPGAPGGTGVAFDWKRAGEAPAWARTVLAGGLTPVNVADAIRTARPYAVDVSSGVEERPGHKDAHAIRAFVAAVRSADEEEPDV
ncbi:MAG: phosphoribosylanthranilate isomerase [Anaerosomatales bacterium]|nr:phosphoribosylanthranilate isomerase [Anaerosomatales bacterium]